MTQPNDGGPAFPRPASQHSGPQLGMSLRDWFAGQALAGIMAGRSSWNSVASEVMKNEGLIGDVSMSEVAYRFADAMLEARGQNG